MATAAKKFYVLFSEKNLFLPKLFQSQASIKAKIKINHELRSEEFVSEALAQGFLYMKKKQYFTLLEKFENEHNSKESHQIKDYLSASQSKNPAIPQGSQPKIISFDWLKKTTGSQNEYRQKKDQVKKAYKDALALIKQDKFPKSSPKKGIEYNKMYHSYFHGQEGEGFGYYVLSSRNQIMFQRAYRAKIAGQNKIELLAYASCLLDCRLNGIENLRVYGYGSLFPFESQPLLSPELANLTLLSRSISETFSTFETEKLAQNSGAYIKKLFSRKNLV